MPIDETREATKMGVDFVMDALSDFCGSQLWDVDLTWNKNITEQPDLTICFEKTVMVFMPCAFLWLTAWIEVYSCMKSRGRDIPWNFLNIGKIVLTVFVMIVQLFDIIYALIRESNSYILYPVDLYMPLVKFVTFGLSIFLVVFTKKHGIQSSGTLFLFWFMMALCEAFRVRTMTIRNQEGVGDELDYIVFMLYYPVVCGLTLLNCWADDEPIYRDDGFRPEKPCSEKGSSFVSRLFFFWFDGLAWKGYKKPLEFSDLWDLNYNDKSSYWSPIFDKFWGKAMERHKAVPDSDAEKDKAEKPQLSLMPTICRIFGSDFFAGASLKLIQDLLMFLSPLLLNLLIMYIKSEEEQWKGILYAILLFVNSCAQTLVLGQYFHKMFTLGMRIKTTLTCAIYRKALRMSNAARKESTVGEIVNLMSVDVQRFQDLTAYLNMLWSAPLQIGLSIFFLWRTLGPSILAGLAVMILLVPLNAVIASKSKKLQFQQMKKKDQRVKLMNEILSGMKVLKFYAWEPSFQKQVNDIRAEEISTLKRMAYYLSVGSFIWTCAPFLVAIATFTTYVTVDETHVLDAQKAFVSLSLFNILRFPLNVLPMMISAMIQAYVGVKRLSKFMNTSEINPDSVTKNTTDFKDSIVIENGSFSWEDGGTTLRNISLTVPQGSLTAIVGTVGSGKSSLISAILGEMEKISGRVNCIGRVAYVSQQPWVQNATLKDNILFSTPYDPIKYSKIIESCALTQDLDILPAKDKTEIGEKGINLSGGQKARVALARSVYNNADIYLLDDPLSAVDVHVGKHIFEKVIGPNGVLKNKTRVLVTHGITFLPKVDNIIVLKDGEISECGTYKQLLEKKGAFAEFLMQHIAEDEEDESKIIHDLENVIGSKELARKISVIAGSERERKFSGSSEENGSVLTNSGKHSLDEKSGKVPKTKQSDKLIEAEKAEIGQVKLAVYVQYLRAIGPLMTFIVLLLHLILYAFSVSSDIWLSIWSNAATYNVTEEKSNRNMYISVYGGLGAGQAISSMFGAIILFSAALQAAQHLHKTILRGVIHSPMQFFDTTPIGRILNRFSKDIDVIDVTLPPVIRGCLNCFFSVVATIGVICYSTPLFLTVIVPVGVVYIFVQRFYVVTSRQLKRLESISKSPIYSHFGETLTGVTTIRAYNMQERFMHENENKVDFNQQVYYPSIVSNRWLAVRLEFIGNFIIFFAALFAVLQRDSMSAGLVGLSVSYALQITQTLNWFVRMACEIETNIVAVERIKEYGDAPGEAPWECIEHQPSPRWPEKGGIQFSNYKTRYREGLDPVLKGLNCKIEPSEKIGIVGRTGAGKSSLTLALFRIIEAIEGSINIDGIDIASLGLHDVRKRITIIPQDPVLFSGTLRTNLDPFEVHSDAEIWRSLELAHLKSFVRSLPAELEHEISEGGENVSVGQRQLFCLARALLRKTKILVLDEATAAVDLETDNLIQQTIKTEFSSCTILVIAHRLNSIMDSTRVMVLDSGHIIEFDSPANLLKDKSSVFYGMAKDAGVINSKE